MEDRDLQPTTSRGTPICRKYNFLLVLPNICIKGIASRNICLIISRFEWELTQNETDEWTYKYMKLKNGAYK